MIDGWMLQDAAQMKLDVLSAMHLVVALETDNTCYNQELLCEV
jgi:hypothetical protein